MLTDDELRELASKATPGPWKSGWREPLYSHNGEDDVDAAVIYTTAIMPDDAHPRDKEIVSSTWYDGPISGCTIENSDYIAACDPQTILRLLDEKDRLAARVAELEAEIDEVDCIADDEQAAHQETLLQLATIQANVAEAVAAEREACAKIAESSLLLDHIYLGGYSMNDVSKVVCEKAAAAIRARGT